jgi:hypothetical protein
MKALPAATSTSTEAPALCSTHVPSCRDSNRPGAGGRYHLEGEWLSFSTTGTGLKDRRGADHNRGTHTRIAAQRLVPRHCRP